MKDNKYIYITTTKKELKDVLIDSFVLLKKKLSALGENIQVVKTEYLPGAEDTVALKILPDGIYYKDVNTDNIDEIIEKTILKGEIIDKLQYQPDQKQYRIVLRNCGIIDPEAIDDYKEREGYKALEKVLKSYSKEDIIEELKKSGLRGRGGAGFPTWMKWDLSKAQQSDQKYIICNADEGDPGAYMDRSVLEGDPHSIIEGMAIAGYAIDSDQGYIYVRAEYELAIKRLEKAIEQAQKQGFLGKNIFGSKFNFNIEIRLGAGAFVCGEETALITSIEGNRGMPKPRPPYPSVKGLWSRPTVINNVETLANVPAIFLKGGDWFGKIGTENSKGTKVFALTGKIKYSGLIEVPMGTTLREIIYEIGGGIKNNIGFKAIQTGGPSGGVISEEYLDTPIDYNSLQKLGSIMGSGGMIIMDQTDCLVDVAKFYLGFSVDESCGKCAPCRIGGFQMYEILKDITSGKGIMEDIEKLKKIGTAMQKASLCGLGQTTPNPVLSSLEYFYDEFIGHITKKICLAKKCKDLLQYKIITENCIGCGLCAMNCAVNAITGEKRKAHVIDQEICIKCGKCFQVCRFNAVEYK